MQSMLRSGRTIRVSARYGRVVVKPMTQNLNICMRRFSIVNNSTQLRLLSSVRNHNHTHNRLYPTIQKRHFSLPEHEVVGMPALSPSVERSKIVEWKCKEGDLVAADEAIAVVETDKAQLDWRVTDDVYVAKLLISDGDEVEVGHPVCVWVEEAADVAAFANFTPGDASAPASDTPASSAAPERAAPAANPLPPLPEYEIQGMPALSPTATDGAITEWIKKEGDFVEEGTEIAQIQTDKSVVAWVAIDEGYIAKRLYPADASTKIEVNEPIAILVENKDDVAAFADIDGALFLSKAAPEEAAPITEAPKSTPKPAAAPSKPAKAADTAGRVKASPLAANLAAELGVPLNKIKGTGPRGRITEKDVRDAAAAGVTADAPTPAAAAAAPVGGATPAVPIPMAPMGTDRSYVDIPLTTMREVIAKRLCESKFSAPHYYETVEIEMDRLLQVRKEMNEDLDVKVSVNDFIVKATAQAIRDTPLVNVSWLGDKMRQYNYVDICMAVATPSGLITPIVKDADQRGLRSIALTTKDLAKRAREGKLGLDEFQGGTFTISNLGMFGVKQFTAIINPPQSCILAVGGASQVLRPDPNSAKGFKAVTTMLVTLSSDHRTVDGAVAAQFLTAFRKYMQSPAKLML